MSTFANSPQGELHAHLLSSIGEGVYDAVEKSEIAIGNKAAPAQPDPPVTAAPTAVPATPQADPASAPAASPEPSKPVDSQPATPRLVLGKYKTEEEAERGYHEILKMNKSLLAQLDATKTAPVPAPAASPLPVAEVPTISAGAMERLKVIEETTGVPTAELEAALVEIARDTARQEYTRIQEPQLKRQQADVYMEENFPEAINFSDEIAQFVKTDASTNHLVSMLWGQGNFKEAMEIGYKNWKFNTGAQQEHQLRVAEEVRKEEVAAARIDAGLMSTSAQSSRENADTGVTSEELAKLAALSRAGYNKPFLDATIKKMLPDSVFGPDAG